jgi:hypothetical protein
MLRAGRYKLCAVALAAALTWPGPAAANPDIAKRYIADAKKVGDGVLTYLFWDVYRATLYAPAAGWTPDGPFVLSLRYLRDLDGADIAERTIGEIRDQGFTDTARLAAWQARLAAIFPDVSDGVTLSATRDEKGRTVFYRGTDRIGAVDDTAFAKHFFDIWLGEKTSEPKLRRALLGG